MQVALRLVSGLAKPLRRFIKRLPTTIGRLSALNTRHARHKGLGHFNGMHAKCSSLKIRVSGQLRNGFSESETRYCLLMVL